MLNQATLSISRGGGEQPYRKILRQADFNGQFINEDFVGKISIVLKDSRGSTLTQSESGNSNLGRVVRYDPKLRSMLIRFHRKS